MASGSTSDKVATNDVNKDRFGLIMLWVDSVIFIRGHTLLPDNTIIVEEASENVTLVYSLDDKLFAF